MINTIHYETSQTTTPQHKTPEETRTSGQTNFSGWFGGDGNESSNLLSITSNERGVWEDKSEAIDFSIREIFDANCFKSPDLSIMTREGLNYQEPFLERAVTSRQTEPKLWSISNEEWALIKPLLSKEGGISLNHRHPKSRKALNSLLFILINGSLNVPLPKNSDFSAKRTIYDHLPTWRKDKLLEKVLAILEKESREPLKSYYRELLKNFQKFPNPKDHRRFIHDLKLSSVEGLAFEGVTDEQWNLVEPLLSNKPDHRSTLNSIFSILINGTFSSVSRHLAEKREVEEYLALWEKDRTLEKVLIQLIEGSKDRLQSDYRKMLSHLQKNLAALAIPQPQPTRNEECALVTTSNLDHQETSFELTIVTRSETDPELFRLSDREWNLVQPSQPTTNEECALVTTSNLDHQETSFELTIVTRSETDPELFRLSNREWNLVQPLLYREIKNNKAKPRKALNSILAILINGGLNVPLPKNSGFSARRTIYDHLRTWRKDKLLEKVLAILEKESREPLKSYYRKLLKTLQKFPNSKDHGRFIHDLKLSSVEGLAFQGVTDRQWRLVEPLLVEKIGAQSASRPALNSIFSVIMNGVLIGEVPVNGDFCGKSEVYRTFVACRKDGTLKKVLTRLIEESQGKVQSDYRKVLNRLEENLSLSSMRMLAKQERYPLIKISSTGEKME